MLQKVRVPENRIECELVSKSYCGILEQDSDM